MITNTTVKKIYSYYSPLFCVLELLGFILSYVSILLFFTYSASLLNCYMLPITFYVSLSVILGYMKKGSTHHSYLQII